MDDGRRLAVQVEQAPRDVAQHAQLDVDGDAGVSLQHLVEVRVEVLHDHHGQVGGGQEADAEELDNMRMTEILEEATLADELLDQVALPVSGQKNGVEPLTGTHGSLIR